MARDKIEGGYTWKSIIVLDFSLGGSRVLWRLHIPQENHIYTINNSFLEKKLSLLHVDTCGLCKKYKRCVTHGKQKVMILNRPILELVINKCLSCIQLPGLLGACFLQVLQTLKSRNIYYFNPLQAVLDLTLLVVVVVVVISGGTAMFFYTSFQKGLIIFYSLGQEFCLFFV